MRRAPGFAMISFSPMLRALAATAVLALTCAGCASEGRQPEPSLPAFATKTFELNGYKITAAVSNGDRVKKYDSHLIVGSVTQDGYNGVTTTISVQACSSADELKRTKPCPPNSEKGWANELLASELGTTMDGKPIKQVVEPVTVYADHVAGFVVKNQSRSIDAGSVRLTVLHSNPSWPHVVRCAVRLSPQVAKLAQQAKRHCIELRVAR